MISKMKQITDLVEQGRQDWLEFYKDFSVIDTDYVCLLPYSSNEFTTYSILHLKQFLEQVNCTVYVVTNKEIIIKALAYLKLDTKSVYVPESKIVSLISYYNLYMFTDKLIILSPTQPKGRTAFNLVEQGIIDVQEFISIGLFKNRSFKRAQPINYEGSDIELAEFFSLWKEDQEFGV